MVFINICTACSDSKIFIAYSNKIASISISENKIQHFPLAHKATLRTISLSHQSFPPSFTTEQNTINDKKSLTPLYLCSGGDDKIVIIWNQSLQEIIASKLFLKKITSSTFSLCNKYIVIGDKFGDVFILSIPDLIPIKTFFHNNSLDHRFCLHENYIQPPTPKLISSDDSFEFCCFSHHTTISHLLFLNDSILCSVDSDGLIRLNQWPQYHIIHTFCMGHDNFITDIISISPDNFLSCGFDGTLRIYDTKGISHQVLTLIDNNSNVNSSNEESKDIPLHLSYSLSFSILAISFLHQPVLKFFSFSGHDCQILNSLSIDLPDIPLQICWFKDYLCVFFDSSLLYYQYEAHSMKWNLFEMTPFIKFNREGHYFLKYLLFDTSILCLVIFLGDLPWYHHLLQIQTKGKRKKMD